MKSEKNKLGFFQRMKIAIFKLEEYGVFLGEKVSVSVKYFIGLIALMAVLIVASSSYNFYKMMDKATNYIVNELPDFSFNEGIIKFENKVEAYDHDYKFSLYINTDDEVSKETLENYQNRILDSQEGLIILKDKVKYITNGEIFEKNFSDLLKNYDLEITNKQDLINNINTVGINNFVFTYFVFSFITMFCSNLITVFADLLLIAAFGYVASMFCGVRFKFAPMVTLSIYSLTLSIVLSIIYNVQYIFTGFVIKYFNIMYILIAYVYIVAAIFMIKYDLIKQNEELQRIIEVQKQVRKEAEEKEVSDELNNKSNEKEEKEDNKKDNNDTSKDEEPIIEDKEPDGSEI